MPRAKISNALSHSWASSALLDRCKNLLETVRSGSVPQDSQRLVGGSQIWLLNRITWELGKTPHAQDLWGQDSGLSKDPTVIPRLSIIASICLVVSTLHLY